MSDEPQIFIPESFTALFVPPGRTRPQASRTQVLERYELCEDLAQMLVDTAASRVFELGISEADALQRCHQGLVLPGAPVSAPEAGWVIRRLAELLGWPWEDMSYTEP